MPAVHLDIGRAEVRPIAFETARSIIKQYEWLGTMPAVPSYCFGIFFDGVCGGAVTYGPEYAENLGVWDRYGYTGKIITPPTRCLPAVGAPTFRQQAHPTLDGLVGQQVPGRNRDG